MTNRITTMQLTWAGYDAAVDLIAAQCPRDRDVVCGMDRGGMLLAWALSDRLGIECAQRPASGALLLYGLVERSPRTRCADALIWAWVDATGQKAVQSVVKVTAGMKVLMPWQDAGASQRRDFVAGFDD